MSNVQLTFADRFIVSVKTLKGLYFQQTTGHTINRDAIEINHAEEMGYDVEARKSSGKGQKKGTGTKSEEVRSEKNKN